MAENKTRPTSASVDGFPRHQALLDRLGKHRHGKSCLYIKRLADVDEEVLEELLA
jgi:hypothetical protein